MAAQNSRSSRRGAAASSAQPGCNNDLANIISAACTSAVSAALREANLVTNEDFKEWSEKANTRFDRHEERLDELQKEMRELKKTGRSVASEKASDKAARAAGEEAATTTWQKREQSTKQAAPVRHLLHVRGFAPFECEAERKLSKDDAKKLGEAWLDLLPEHKAAKVRLLEPFLRSYQIQFKTYGDMSREEAGAFLP